MSHSIEETVSIDVSFVIWILCNTVQFIQSTIFTCVLRMLWLTIGTDRRQLIRLASWLLKSTLADKQLLLLLHASAVELNDRGSCRSITLITSVLYYVTLPPSAKHSNCYVLLSLVF